MHSAWNAELRLQWRTSLLAPGHSVHPILTARFPALFLLDQELFQGLVYQWFLSLVALQPSAPRPWLVPEAVAKRAVLDL
jgi:hypothetical protein